MKEKNNYGMMSGGFIFDALDRFALEQVRVRYNIPKKTPLVTASAFIKYSRQLCNKKYTLFCDSIEKRDAFESRPYFDCTAEIRDPDGLTIARATFTFTLTTNHCLV